MNRLTMLSMVFPLLLAGCTRATPEVSVTRLRYFGFAAIDCGWDDLNDGLLKTTYLDEVEGFTNAAQLCPFSPQEVLGARLTRFREAGVGAIVNLEGLFFESVLDTSSPTGERLELVGEAEVRWRAFVERNRTWLTPAYVAALYIADEPAWRGAAAGDVAAAVALVEAALPELPTMIVEAYPALDKLVVPPALDWLGFDRFGHAEPAHDPVWLADLDKVRAARTRSDQRLVIIADTQWYPQYETVLGLSREDMAGVVRSYAEVASRYPEVVALIGYSWPGGLDGPAQQGARSLPETVQEAFREIGAGVRGR